MSEPLRRLALRNVRIAATVYLVILIVATHWPKLNVAPSGPPIDKLMHFMAFGLMAVALACAQWFTKWWTLLLAAAVFTLLDEISQAKLSVGRHFDTTDVVAGWMGVIVAVALVSAFGPVGGRNSLERRERWIDAAASLLARAAPWLLIGISGALGVLVGSIVLVFLDSFYPQPHPARAWLVGGLIGGIALAHWTFEAGVRRESLLIQEQARCRSCGNRIGKPEHPEEPQQCPRCKNAIDPAGWEPLTPLSREVLVTAIFRPTLVAGILLILLGVGWIVLLFTRFSREQLPLDSIAAWWKEFGLESQWVLDLTVVGLLASITLWIVRIRLARQIDAQAVRCIGCGQDLTGVPLENGIGRCPECGGRFRREESAVCSPQ